MLDLCLRKCGYVEDGKKKDLFLKLFNEYCTQLLIFYLRFLFR